MSVANILTPNNYTMYCNTLHCKNMTPTSGDLIVDGNLIASGLIQSGTSLTVGLAISGAIETGPITATSINVPVVYPSSVIVDPITNIVNNTDTTGPQSDITGITKLEVFVNLVYLVDGTQPMIVSVPAFQTVPTNDTTFTLSGTGTIYTQSGITLGTTPGTFTFTPGTNIQPNTSLTFKWESTTNDLNVGNIYSGVNDANFGGFSVDNTPNANNVLFTVTCNCIGFEADVNGITAPKVTLDALNFVPGIGGLAQQALVIDTLGNANVTSFPNAWIGLNINASTPNPANPFNIYQHPTPGTKQTYISCQPTYSLTTAGTTTQVDLSTNNNLSAGPPTYSMKLVDQGNWTAQKQDWFITPGSDTNPQVQVTSIDTNGMKILQGDLIMGNGPIPSFANVPASPGLIMGKCAVLGDGLGDAGIFLLGGIAFPKTSEGNPTQSGYAYADFAAGMFTNAYYFHSPNNGTAILPSYTWENALATGTGIYFDPADSKMKFSNAGTYSMAFDTGITLNSGIFTGSGFKASNIGSAFGPFDFYNTTDTTSGQYWNASKFNYTISNVDIASISSTTITSNGVTLNNSVPSYVPNNLNYYEELAGGFSASFVHSDTTIIVTCGVTRIGRIVTLSLPEITSGTTIVSNSYALATASTIPARFVPSTNQYATTMTYSSVVNQFYSLLIGTDGSMRLGAIDGSTIPLARNIDSQACTITWRV
jgi:hypothetical protein